jgi:signal transduction histidine kinase/CheY-like chemotaxis protein
MNPSSPVHPQPAKSISRGDRICAAQLQLLGANVNVGVGVTLVAAAILAQLQWAAISHPVILGWCLYMVLVSLARFAQGRLYRRTPLSGREIGRWRAAFAMGAGLAGAGWGAAGIFLYPQGHLANQVFLAFMLGGMMLGAASLLAPRPESFLAFIPPTGLALAARLALQDDANHVAMGLMACLFTLVTLVTTWRIHRTIVSSLNLRFNNQDLVGDLRAANSRAEALNEHLEVRVQERTAELRLSAEQLRAEIAQREHIEEELLRARKLESLGVLAGGIAHDFNNFLTVVQGNIQLAGMRLGPDQPVQANLDQISEACRRAAFLSSQLLTFAKGGVPVRRLVSVGQLVRDAVHLARAGAPTSIAVGIAENLRFAEVDPAQIGQVLHNLLLNARQAMPEGGIIEVQADNVVIAEGIGEAASDARILISIRDYGCGIPASVLPQIFDPYFTTKPGASGLGLATAYAIVAKHGGALSVETEPGRGSVFTVELPASPVPAPEAPAEIPAPQLPGAAGKQRGAERLLVMDDEEALRRLLEAVLTGLGYEVELARDGAEAIALCENAKAAGRNLDAALLDLTVCGGMGGVDAAARLKELDPQLKLIVSSGYSDAPVMSDFRKYGFDAVIPKPWVIAEISQVFESLLTADPAARQRRRS